MREGGFGSSTHTLLAEEVSFGERAMHCPVLSHVVHFERAPAGAADLLVLRNEAPAHLSPAAHNVRPQH